MYKTLLFFIVFLSGLFLGVVATALFFHRPHNHHSLHKTVIPPTQDAMHR